jgi:DNA-binding winged helix-turn-helix (wHTH) protein
VPPDYRFGPFLVDRTGYRVLRGNQVLDLTPKLLDVLVHLLENAGALVTKEQLLDTLWPDANVTDNALTQAVSELRQALGDEASTPKFIKTVARRGYRFIAPVERVDPAAPAAAAISRTAEEPAIAVMDFTNVTGEADSAWLSAGIAETVTGDLRTIGRFRVVDRARVADAMRRTGGSLQDISADLGTTFAVVGSYQRQADRIRINARIVNVKAGETLADAKVDGLFSAIFDLQDRIVTQFSSDLGASAASAAGARDTASLEAYRAYTEGWLHLETLDLREIPKAIASFERAVEVDPKYALAFTGLASAQLAAYEATRCENIPDRSALGAAIERARRAVALDDRSAEAHATLAFVLVSAWETGEALHAARRAVALEPANWRHFFRLGHASWGDERLRASKNTLALYPDFAFAHFQAAMVHVARGHLREAESVLRQGAAVQDRQVARGDRYPALGLHWLLALVRLAEDDDAEALREFDRERELVASHRLYGREYEMSALLGRGACLLRRRDFRGAAEAFAQSLALYPGLAQAHLGLSIAWRAMRLDDRADSALRRARDIQKILAVHRPIEAELVNAQLLAAEGRTDEMAQSLTALLDSAPPGFAAWTIPVEPILSQVCDKERLTTFTKKLGDRAR